MNRFFLSITGLLGALLIFSCSGNNQYGTAPDINNPQCGSTSAGNSSNACLWGIWDIYVDTENQTLKAVPLRSAGFTANVVRFVDGPPLNLILQLGTIDVQPAWTDIPVDVGLKHPFPGLAAYTGFDVLGVFMGNGSGAYIGPGGFPVQNSSDQFMMNPDGFTRWFNANEFAIAGEQMPLLGYKPGKLGSSGYVPTAILNPYKYFCDGLDKNADAFEFLSQHPDSRGAFRPGSVNYRHYALRFPTPNPGIKFQYAVIAHWEPNVNSPNPPSSLDDFPPSANSDEALVIKVVDKSTLFYVNPTNFGGKVILDISPIDWSAQCSGSGVMEEYEIRCYSTAWSGAGLVDMTPVGSGPNFCTFHVEIPVTTLTSADKIPVWIEVLYPGLDYTNKFNIMNLADGALASYFLIHVPVSGEAPGSITVIQPNGGEVLQVGGNYEIKWDSENLTGKVDIDYSKDGFVSDVHTIVKATDDDGSYMWTNIPNDPSTTVKVRVSSTNIPSIFDVSDGNFTIKFGYGWVKTWGGGGNDRAYGITKDSSGNMYVTGFYYGTVDFDPDPGKVDNHPGFGSWDSFVSKFNSEGNLIWAKTWGATGYADSARDVAVDSSGNVFVTGWWQNNLTPPQIDLDPGPGVDWKYGKIGDNIYLIKLNSSGIYQWGHSWSANDWDFSVGEGVVADSSGNVYMTGHYQGTIDFDPGSGVANLTPAGYKDAFLLKLSPSGTFQWALGWGGSLFDYAYDVEMTPTGNILVVGSFYGSGVDFNPGTGTDIRNSNGGYDAFLSVFDSNGNYQWARTWGGSSDDRCWDVAVDNSANILLAGQFGATVDFNPSGGNPLNSAGGLDAFVSKFNSSGNFIWARTWGGAGSDLAYCVTSDPSGSVGVGGYFEQTVDFDPGSGNTSYTAFTSHDAFMSKFDSNGTFQWANAWGGVAQTSGGGVEDEAWGIISDVSGNFYVTGVFQNACDFEPGPGTTIITAGGGTGVNDCYLLKFLPGGTW